MAGLIMRLMPAGKFAVGPKKPKKYKRKRRFPLVPPGLSLTRDERFRLQLALEAARWEDRQAAKRAAKRRKRRKGLKARAKAYADSSERTQTMERTASGRFKKQR